jgi:RNA polymerase sigma factor (TIGR02999 family)
MTDVTRILSKIESGDSAASDELLLIVYDELRKLASAKLAKEAPGQTIQATELVHEAYIRLVGDEADHPWSSRGHFFGAAAEAMRRILIERARRKHRVKHGGELRRLELDETCAIVDPQPDEIVDLDEALQRFELIDPVRAKVVKLRFYSGLSIPDTAKALGLSKATVDRHWKFARTWLFAEMTRDPNRDAKN